MAITPAQYGQLVSPAILQEALLDKDTGLAMAGGFVTFFQDAQRQTLKNVYYQTNVAGQYMYIPIPNPNRLTANGCLSDPGGNAIIPFFFPWDEADDTVPQPYYVVVKNANLVPQFTLQNFPFISPEATPSNTQQDLLNFMPNPQFAAHNNLPNDLYPNGTASVVVAPGGSNGWVFEKPTISTDVDNIVFTYLTSEPNSLTGNPRWAITSSSQTSGGTDNFKNLIVRFDNVNRFASLTQFYTLGFYGINNNTGTVPISVELHKFFGTDGATSTTNILTTFELDNTSWGPHQIAFVFGENNSAIGPFNDDYFELWFSFPSTGTYSASLTDFYLIPGVVNVEFYPERPDNIVFAEGIAGSMPTPDPDGADLYLPIIYTKTGFNFDDSTIGYIYASNALTTPAGYLYGDGTTYFNNQFDATTGIPYARLGNVYWSGGNYGNIPLYGTGSDFITAATFASDTAGNLFLTNNQASTATLPADGLSATGFSFATQTVGGTTAPAFFSGLNGSTGFVVRTNATDAGTPSTFNINTTGFISSAISAPFTNAYFNVGINGVTGASITPGAYFIVTTTTQTLNVWYSVNGSGSSPGGTAIKVPLLSTDTSANIASKTLLALSGGWMSRIGCTAASTLATGDYFTFGANGVTYNVTYSINNAALPLPIPSTTIVVNILSTDDAAAVEDATLKAINQFAFAVPDLQGQFLRGTDPSNIWSANNNKSGFGNPNWSGEGPGTWEIDTFADHTHTYVMPSIVAGTYAGGGALSTATVVGSTVGYTGSSQNKPLNVTVNWVIKF